MKELRPRIIESLDNWYILKQALIDQGYHLWQMQYQHYLPEGYYCWFIKDSKNVEVITHCKEVQEDILNSKMK